jgi:hypothetical protein
MLVDLTCFGEPLSQKPEVAETAAGLHDIVLEEVEVVLQAVCCRQVITAQCKAPREAEPTVASIFVDENTG